MEKKTQVAMNPEPDYSYYERIFLLSMDLKNKHSKERFFNIYTAAIYEKCFYYPSVLSRISMISSEIKSSGATLCEDYFCWNT